MLNDLKLLVGLELSDLSKDDLLNLLLRLARSDAKKYCKIENEEELKGLEDTIVEMAVCRYNWLGSEGISSESYSGASFSYLDNYPANIRMTLDGFNRGRARFY